VLSTARQGSFVGKDEQYNTDADTVASIAVTFAIYYSARKYHRLRSLLTIITTECQALAFHKKTVRIVRTPHAFVCSTVIPTCLPSKAPYSINQLQLQIFKIWITVDEIIIIIIEWVHNWRLLREDSAPWVNYYYYFILSGVRPSPLGIVANTSLLY
jgi:hypothetical protein